MANEYRTIIIDDANDRKRSKMNTTMSYVVDLNHCYQKKNICQAFMPLTEYRQTG